MPTARPHWSYSAINQYLRCPLQYYFERVLRLPKPFASGGLVLGSAVHAALADYHLYLKRGRSTSLDRLNRVLLANWTLHEAERPIQYKAGENRVSLLATGVGLLETYLKEPAPERIVSVEKEILSPLVNSHGEYLETPLLAVVDLITQERDGLKISEFKTSNRAFGQSEVDTSLQATCYASAAWHSLVQRVAIEFMVFVKNKNPRIQHIATNRTQKDLGRLGDIVESVERAVDQRLFFPIESPLNCSSCPFRAPCREWRPELHPQPVQHELVSINGQANAH